MSYFSRLAEGGYEGLHFFHDPRSGLRALIALHNTKLGPGLGGTRALTLYGTEEEAVTDVLRLSRGMTYKAALAGLAHGGGKAVIMLPKGSFERPRLFEAFGKAVETLGGRYITTEDSGTSPDDMATIRTQTRYVCGLHQTSGDPSPVTAFGVVRAMEAAAKHVWGSPDLKGKKVTVMGIGNVGLGLVSELAQRGATVYVQDVRPERVSLAQKEFGATPLSADAIIAQEADIFAPCALGATLDPVSIPKLKVKVVCGAANNQLATPADGERLAARGIVYVPDYAANAGGLINVAQEWSGYDRAQALARAGRIYDTVETVLRRSKEERLRPEQVADRMVEELLA
jgi:leucine dehydrogenase